MDFSFVRQIMYPVLDAPRHSGRAHRAKVFVSPLTLIVLLQQAPRDSCYRTSGSCSDHWAA